MKITAASVALTALLVLGLTGCAGTGTDAGDASTAPVASESVAPLVAEEPAVPEGGDEAAYLEEVRDRLPATTVIPNATDEQLIAAGWEACAQREAGVSGDDLTVIEGEQRNEITGAYRDSAAILAAARVGLCPVAG